MVILCQVGIIFYSVFSLLLGAKARLTWRKTGLSSQMPVVNSWLCKGGSPEPYPLVCCSFCAPPLPNLFRGFVIVGGYIILFLTLQLVKSFSFTLKLMHGIMVFVYCLFCLYTQFYDYDCFSLFHPGEPFFNFESHISDSWNTLLYWICIKYLKLMTRPLIIK